MTAPTVVPLWSEAPEARRVDGGEAAARRVDYEEVERAVVQPPPEARRVERLALGRVEGGDEEGEAGEVGVVEGVGRQNCGLRSERGRHRCEAQEEHPLSCQSGRLGRCTAHEARE